ncbi:hypothetical protein ACEWY4_016561 [Coilia grayii]|uniref:E3 ubiquitin/ISG15 ligase TRIM25-like n=1 Tax=Coilia grayii TaxID=363190 RepID=A0ABD1JKQ1_9TELE
MAESDQNPFNCAVCLDTWRDPVTIPCGHNYCMHCICGCWDREDEKGVYSCPVCKESFSPRPALKKNTVLAELVGKMKTVTNTPSVSSYAEAGDVECDFCTGRKLKAEKSCLVCLVSMCETHIQPHYDVPALRKHKLVKATAELQDRVCTKHDKLLEVFCRTDQTSICILCTMDEHKGHETTSAAAERAQKQNQVMEMKGQFQREIQETEKNLQELRETFASHKKISADALAHGERTFTQLIQYFEGKRSEVKELILAQQKEAVIRAEEILQELEQKATELRRGDAELAELCHEEDHLCFLQRFYTFKNCPALKNTPIMMPTLSECFEDLSQSLSAMRQTVEKVCDGDMVTLSAKIKEIEIARKVPAREDLLKYSCRLTLDPNTASADLFLSEGNTEVTTQYTGSFLPSRSTSGLYVAVPNAGVFSFSNPHSSGQPSPKYQVLCVQGLTGQCYWEIERSCEKEIDIGVAYKSICNMSLAYNLGHNDKSWSLSCNSEGCSFWHSDTKTDILAVMPGTRIGVYLDHKEGTLSFYNVSDVMTLLHRVCTTFTEPLYPGFRLENGAFLKICEL